MTVVVLGGGGVGLVMGVDVDVVDVDEAVEEEVEEVTVAVAGALGWVADGFVHGEGCWFDCMVTLLLGFVVQLGAELARLSVVEVDVEDSKEEDEEDEDEVEDRDEEEEEDGEGDRREGFLWRKIKLLSNSLMNQEDMSWSWSWSCGERGERERGGAGFVWRGV